MYNYNNFESIKTIGDFNEVIDEDNWTHFHYICYYDCNLDIIKYCVGHGADLNIKNRFKKTPFLWICCDGTTKEILEYCLENGADLTIKSVSERTPFYYICKYAKHLIPICKPYMDEYYYIKTLKEFNLNWKEYVF